MAAIDLVLKKQTRAGVQHQYFGADQSPVFLRDNSSKNLLGLAECENGVWIYRSFVSPGEYELSNEPLYVTHQGESWYLVVHKREHRFADELVKQDSAEPRRQVILLSSGRVIHSELLPVDVIKSQHPYLSDFLLPALLDEKWVSVELKKNLILKTRVVYLNDPTLQAEKVSPMPVLIGLLFFAVFIITAIFSAQKLEEPKEQVLAPIEVSAAKIAQIEQAMSQPDEPSASAGSSEPNTAAVPSETKAKPKDAKLVKLNSSLSKLLGAASARLTGALGTGEASAMPQQNLNFKAQGGGLSKGQALKDVGPGRALNAGALGKASVSWLEEEAIMEDGLDRDVIARIIRSHLGEIRYCYERQLSADPNLEGKVQVRFVIGGLGAVVDRKVNQSTLHNGFVEGCILQKVATWTFPKTKGGVNVAVTYPFLFRLSSE